MNEVKIIIPNGKFCHRNTAHYYYCCLLLDQEFGECKLYDREQVENEDNYDYGFVTYKCKKCLEEGKDAKRIKKRFEWEKH